MLAGYVNIIQVPIYVIYGVNFKFVTNCNNFVIILLTRGLSVAIMTL